MKKLFDKITDMLADAALLEMGVNAVSPDAKAGTTRETLEENLIEIAFAEEADYEDIHKAIMREHELERKLASFDNCRYGEGDNRFDRRAA